MSDNNEAEVLRRILDRLPSVPWSSRLDPVTMTSEWVYTSPRMAELYGLTEEELRGNTFAVLDRFEPADAAQLRELLALSFATLAPLTWTGRLVLRGGASRWIETQIYLEREPDGKIRSYGQAFDVTERMRAERLHRQVIDALPAGVMVLTPDGKFPVYNRTAYEYVPRLPGDHADALLGTRSFFKSDGVTPYPNEELPLVRALQGEENPETEMIIRESRFEGDVYVHVSGAPIRDEAGTILAGLVVFHDITAQRALEQELRTRNEQLAASEETKTGLIDRLRYSIDELSNPILEVWDDVLVMPIIGVIDSRRTADMVQRLLAEVTRTQSSFVIIDLTGVEIVDTQTANHLMKLIRKVEIIGSRCVLTGIRPAVSETLVDIGVDFGRITTLRNLKHGLREALRFARLQREGARDSDDDEISEEPQIHAGSRRPPR